MPGPLAALALQAAANYVTSELSSNSAQSRQNQMMKTADAYQRNLIRDTPALTVAGMQAAGLSTSMLNGGFSAASSNAASAPNPYQPMSAPNLDASLALQSLNARNLKKQNELLDAQINKVKADKEGVDADNYRKGIENDLTEQYANLQKAKIADEISFGNKLGEEMYKKDSVNIASDGSEVKIPNSVTVPWISEKTYDYLVGNFSRRVAVASNNLANDLKRNEIDFKVLSSQLADKRVIEALKNLPIATTNKILNEVQNLADTHELYTLTKQYQVSAAKYGVDKAYYDVVAGSNKNQLDKLSIALQQLLLKNEKGFNLRNIYDEVKKNGLSFDTFFRGVFSLLLGYIKQ